MPPVHDTSNRCLVLSVGAKLWREVLHPGIRLGSALDGRELSALRVDPEDLDVLCSESVLDVLEHGALVVVDLVEIDPAIFPLVEWLARMRPSSVLLFRHGRAPLPFELHEFLVRSFDVGAPGENSQLRVEVGTLATLAAASREHESPESARNRGRWLERRARNGVDACLRAAVRSVLLGDRDAARRHCADALEIEPKAPDLMLRAAVLDRLGGRWAAARDLLLRATRRNPTCAAAWRELGIVREQAGLEGVERALQRAIDLDADFEALVALALRLARRNEPDRSTQLLDRAMRISGGQLNIVLPTLEARAAQEGRISVAGWERDRLEAVLSIRAQQAQASPPRDAPWSHFDAVRAHTLLGNHEAALAQAEAARAHLSAPWQPQTLGRSLDVFERAGVDVAAIREALGISPRTSDEHAAPEPVAPFAAATRTPAWFAQNVPCLAACPVGTDAGAYVHLLAQERFAEAFQVARAPNPLASVCGRICAAPCEDACRRGNIDEPVQIRTLKRFLTERHGVEGYEPRVDDVLRAPSAPCIEGEAYLGRLRELEPSETPRRVAVVGGGPAGLACAHDLALLGHQVTVFDAAHQLGGMMRQGIPIYRLSRDLIELEIGAILSLGVEVELGRPLNAEFDLAALMGRGFDAVFLSSGAGKGRDLEVEGAHLDGVVRAIDFLLNANQGYRMDLGQRVVVVGGGNVALDVARTARLGRAPDPLTRDAAGQAARETFGADLPGHELRRAVRGAKREVHVIARQPMGEWPAQRTVRGTEELEEAREEGIAFHPLRGVRRFLGENGKLCAVELAEVVQVYDDDGNYAPLYGAHAAEVLACDTAFLAVGQAPGLDYLVNSPDVRCTRRGLIEVDESLATTRPGVFAGGDAAFGPRTLIEAVADGKHAARSMHRWLAGGQPPPMRYHFEALHPRGVPTAVGYDAIPKETPACRALGRRTGIAEVEHGFDEEEAVRQAGRCLVCHVQTVYDGELCIACGRCTDICPHACLSFATPTDVTLADASWAADPDRVVMLKDEDTCVRCGLCAERCPTGAMTMERFHMTPERVA